MTRFTSSKLPGSQAALTTMYHLAQAETASNIRSSGFVEARSAPYGRLKLNERPQRRTLERAGVDFDYLDMLMPSQRYVVGFDKPVPHEWLNAGLGSLIVNHIATRSAKKESLSAEIVSFELNVSPSRVFIRDHSFLSPAYFQRKFGDGVLWNNYVENPLKAIEDSPETAKCVADYLMSSQRMIDSGFSSISVPELWYSGDAPLEKWTGVYPLSKNAIATLRKTQ